MHVTLQVNMPQLPRYAGLGLPATWKNLFWCLMFFSWYLKKRFYTRPFLPGTWKSAWNLVLLVPYWWLIVKHVLPGIVKACSCYFARKSTQMFKWNDSANKWLTAHLYITTLQQEISAKATHILQSHQSSPRVCFTVCTTFLCSVLAAPKPLSCAMLSLWPQKV